MGFLSIFKKIYNQSKEHTDDDESVDESRPSPSLVQVPVHFVVESMKERLRVVKYKEELGSASACAICLKNMSASDEVREQSNCCHVFHRECLDGWMDRGQVTCPLCRSKLLPHDYQIINGEFKCGSDPWRRERMIYLFGEDCFFSN
ncbi:E3 ubiquitin-protein like [Actinidia chinensis var. chinensis]|uniref:E3 ubiquitin-protein like n=1 Tax=Actinidia chinensis var. chinensis TaxID=1590841 RepID=A0A2R6RSG6_ACTCC|nr:E3 ubiquitin-protein like [Actinidia chinensis var. chinensis]